MLHIPDDNNDDDSDDYDDDRTCSDYINRMISSFFDPLQFPKRGKLYGTMDDLRLEHRRVQAKYIVSWTAKTHASPFTSKLCWDAVLNWGKLRIYVILDMILLWPII